jgi:ABC-type transport system involved in Fe-S cluster assembly fused permease/ATPase subunit
VPTPKHWSRFGSLREVFHLVWTEASHFVKVRLGAVLALVVASSVLTALGPVALKLVVDGFTGQTTGKPRSTLVLLGLYVLSQWLVRAVSEIRGLVYARAERRMFRAISERLFAHLMQLPLRYHLDKQTGAVSQALDNGLHGYELVQHHLVFTFLPVAAELGTIIIVLTRVAHPIFLVLFCGALVCYAVAFTYAAITISGPAETASAAHVDAHAAMTDGILNYETVKYFTAESIVQEKVSRALFRTELEWVSFYRRYASNGLVVATIFAVFLGTTILYAAHEVEGSIMTLGDFVLVNTYMLQVIRPVEMLGYAMQGLSQGIAMLKKMLDLFREMPEQQRADDRVPLSGPTKLEFENVILSYPPDRSVLKGVSFKIAAGKTLAIVGESGSGKSTIVRLLVRLLDPDSGRILLDGVPIADLSLAELRRSIAVVPQDTLLFNETIGYNIAFGKAHSTREEMEQAARLAHLHAFIMSLPDKYDTRVGERGVKLSGGEKQRISIARAAIKRPSIYVFDEATSSLDSNTEHEILRNLQEISRFSTTLVIAHRLSTVVHADEIVVLEGGVIVERGTHAFLLRANGRYSALWQAQQQGPVAA